MERATDSSPQNGGSMAIVHTILFRLSPLPHYLFRLANPAFIFTQEQRKKFTFVPDLIRGPSAGILMIKKNKIKAQNSYRSCNFLRRLFFFSELSGQERTTSTLTMLSDEKFH